MKLHKIQALQGLQLWILQNFKKIIVALEKSEKIWYNDMCIYSMIMILMT